MPTTTFVNDLACTGAMAVTGNLTIGGTVNTTGASTRTFANATATAGAATANGVIGKITSEALTTAQNAIYTLTLTNSSIAAADMVVASVANGTNTQGSPVVTRIQPAAGSVVILVANLHASAQALNGTIVITYYVIKAA